MRHGNKLNHLGREASHRKMMLNNLATSVLLQGLNEEQMERHVRTTLPKAKAVRSLVDRLITYGKKGDLSAKRQAARFVKSKDAFKGLFSTLGERYKDRDGGYTRILKLSGNRHGDNAEMAIISLVEDELTKKKKKKPTKRKKATPKATEAVETKAEDTTATVAEEAKSEPPAAPKASEEKAEKKTDEKSE